MKNEKLLLKKVSNWLEGQVFKNDEKFIIFEDDRATQLTPKGLGSKEFLEFLKNQNLLERGVISFESDEFVDVKESIEGIFGYAFGTESSIWKMNQTFANYLTNYAEEYPVLTISSKDIESEG